MNPPSIIRNSAAAAFLALGASVVLAQASAPAAASAPASASADAQATGPKAPDGAAAAETGKLAWYGRKFAGRRTASGEAYDPNALTMAHKTLPFGTHVKVTNLSNKKSVVLRVNDRGPTQGDRVGDVSLAAAKRLGMTRAGVIDAELVVVSAASKKKHR